MGSSAFILGKELRNFEEEFAKFCSARYCVGVNSGTDALFLALKALGIGEGDEVITSVHTYIATALAISFTGARPVFVDIDPVTYNIDPAKIERAITKRSKVILLAHLYGHPVDMAPVMKIARRRTGQSIKESGWELSEMRDALVFIQRRIWARMETEVGSLLIRGG